MRVFLVISRFLLIAWCVALSSIRLLAQGNQIIYDDVLKNSWSTESSFNTNINSDSPVYSHQGTRSIEVVASPAGALWISHAPLPVRYYTDLTFWINGGATGGQHLMVKAVVGGRVKEPQLPKTPYYLPELAANTWYQVTVPLSYLEVGEEADITGFLIQESVGNAHPSPFYVDDLTMIAAPIPERVAVQVNAGQYNRIVDNRFFGINTGVYDEILTDSTTVRLLKDMDNRTFRFPGGSISNNYHWESNLLEEVPYSGPWTTNFDGFAAMVHSVNADPQVFITVNYGSGSPEEAARWVRYSNKVRGYNFRYWEIGNECYGSWEHMINETWRRPVVYAQRAGEYIRLMKKADPTIKVGVVVEESETQNSRFENGVVVNPRTGITTSGWTPVMLDRLRSLGVIPNFVIYHRYPQEWRNVNDFELLQKPAGIITPVKQIRQMLSDYLGDSGSKIEIICTECNSVNTEPGKQTTSIVNGLFLADSIAQAMQTELGGLIWWELHNKREARPDDPGLYGWRTYGDFGILSSHQSEDINTPYPTYFAASVLQYWTRGGDRIVSASSNYGLLSAYAVRRQDGKLAILVINKSATQLMSVDFDIRNFFPARLGSMFGTKLGTMYSYGIPEDNAMQTGLGSSGITISPIKVGSHFTHTFPPYSITVLSLPEVSSRISQSK